MGRLDGKVAIVTGGAKGLGKAFCFALAKEGAKVVMAAHRLDTDEAKQAAKEIESKGGLTVEVDVTNEESTKLMAEKAIKKFGRIDILVNNAAFYYGVGRKPFYEITSEDWDRALDVGAKGAWLCAKAVFPYMKEQNKGKIINLSSDTAFAPTKGMINYITSKAAVVGITRVLAGELGKYNICVNAVAPGYTDTPASWTIGDVSKFDTSTTPLGRVGKPEDIVGAVVFFASDDSDFISGQTLIIDGGRRVH
ncbi:MAG: 3-oxoacyl-ACP reductase FabG [Dehalococcoidales bacterium]|nr:3-oxoacyl-ACP reductase FabG [Dehalococcoidales bacterium]